MKALMVIGSIVFVLLLIALIPVGAEAVYDDDGFQLKLRLWFLRLRLGGKKKRSGGENTGHKGDKAPEQEKKKKKLPPMGMIKIVVKRGYALLCRLVSRFRVEVLRLHFTSAFEDPAVTAMAYAAAGTAMDGLLRVGKGHITFSDLRADVDFDGRSPRVDMRIAIRVRIGQLVGEGLGFACGFLRDFMKIRKELNDGKSSDRGYDGRSDG